MLFLAVYVAVKNSGNTIPEKNKRPMSYMATPTSIGLFSYQKLVARWHGQE